MSDDILEAMKAVRREIETAKDAELPSLRGLQLSGIRIMPHAMIDRPTLMVSEATWKAFVAKYGKAND